MSAGAGLLLVLLMASSQASAKASNDTCLRVAAFKEAGAEPTAGVAAVVQTIKHRAKHEDESICRVVKSPHQFSFYRRGMNLKNVQVPQEFLHKYRKASRMRNVVPSCTRFYHNDKVAPRWARERRYVGRVSHHRFYC